MAITSLADEPLFIARKLQAMLPMMRATGNVDHIKTELLLREREAYGPLNAPEGLRRDAWIAIDELRMEYERGGPRTEVLWGAAIEAVTAWLASLT